jgi:serine O-acetyltransferase
MFEAFKQDIDRWIQLGYVSPTSELTPQLMVLLLYRYVALRAIAWFRFGCWCKEKGIPFLPLYVQRLILRRYGLDIVVGQKIGGGLYIPHPVGTVIAARRIGSNCSIIASATIGMRNVWEFPEIGDNVFVGACARILGGITVGNEAKIGANAVVVDDVPDGATAVGIPAKVKHRVMVESV